MKCVFFEHKCLTFPEPDAQSNVTCKNPVNGTLKNLPREALNGDWNVVDGYSHIYDCINCTWIGMKINEDNTINYSTAYYYTQGINGPFWDLI